MDKNQIITQVIIALITMVTTIVTTIIIVRLSLNKGSLGVTNKLKARFTPKFKTYIKLILSLAFVIYLNILFTQFLTEPNPKPVARIDVVAIFFLMLGCLLGGTLTTRFFLVLIDTYKAERKHREQELLRAHEERQLAEFQPIMDKVDELVRRSQADHPPEDKPAEPLNH